MNTLQLLGLKHTGKSSLGRLWASRHQWLFFDLDEVLESLAGGKRTSRQIYIDEGRVGFQHWETQAAQRVAESLRRGNAVVAWGGGTMTNSSAVEILRPLRPLVALKESAERLYDRILLTGRPAFLSADHPREDFQKLYSERTELIQRLSPVLLDAQGAPLDAMLEKLETLWITLNQS